MIKPTEAPTQPQKDTATTEQPKPLIYGVTGANQDLTINTNPIYDNASDVKKPTNKINLLYQQAERILHNNKDLFSVWLKNGDAEIKLERLTVGERIGAEKKVGFSQ